MVKRIVNTVLVGYMDDDYDGSWMMVHMKKNILVELNGCKNIADNDLLTKHNDSWIRINNCIKKEFDSVRIYNNKILTTKIKSYEEATNFHDKEIPRIKSNYICLAVLLILFLNKMKTLIPKCFNRM